MTIAGGPANSEPAHDPKRFEEVVLFIAEQTADDPEFGSTKVAKVLYHSDIESYRDLGEAITNTRPQPTAATTPHSRYSRRGRRRCHAR
jgi:hypothetical protein